MASRRVRGGNGDHGEGDGEFDPRQSEGDGDLLWGAYGGPANDLLSDSLSEGADPGPDYEEGDETKRELLGELKKVVNATMATSEEHLNARPNSGSCSRPSRRSRLAPTVCTPRSRPTSCPPEGPSDRADGKN